MKTSEKEQAVTPLAVYVTPTERRLLRELAESLDVSLSKLVRRLIQRELKDAAPGE